MQLIARTENINGQVLGFHGVVHMDVGEIIRDMKPRLAAIASVLLLFSCLAFTSCNSRGANMASSTQKSLNASQAGGDTIVYQRVPESDLLGPTVNIYSMNADGSDDRALTHDGHSHSPSWSPDGRRVLFIHDSALEKPPPYRDDCEYKSHHPLELYEMKRDGSDPRFLLRFEPLIDAAQWSPDSEKIIIQTAAQPPLGICLFLWSSDEHREPRQLFPYPAAEPAWSPDGTKVLFVKRHGRWLSSPLVADRDGSHVAPLKHDPGPDVFEPAWSPDGKRIAYVQDNAPPDRTSAIFVMNADGSGIRQLTHDPDWEPCSHPSWSPDGKRIAFGCVSKFLSSCWFSAGSDRSHGRPRCIRRLFVVPVDHPPKSLMPIADHDGADPAFAPN